MKALRISVSIPPTPRNGIRLLEIEGGTVVTGCSAGFLCGAIFQTGEGAIAPTTHQTDQMRVFSVGSQENRLRIVAVAHLNRQLVVKGHTIHELAMYLSKIISKGHIFR